MFEIGLDDLKFRQILLAKDFTMQTTSYSHPLICFSCRNISANGKTKYTVKFCAPYPSQLDRKCELNGRPHVYNSPRPIKPNRLFVLHNTDDSHPSASTVADEMNTNHAPNVASPAFLSNWSPPRSVGVCLLTSAFVGMAFTIQFVREFTRLGLNRSVGGVLALAFSRELSPVVTAIVVAGRIGSAFAAELGTMQVSEQTDTLRVLGSDPVDYLVTPRVIATCIALPLLTLLCFTLGMASSALLADGVYGVSINIILDSAQRALRSWDIISAMIKSQVFGAIISIVSCAWGVTTLGGAKGVGESTTSAVVISLVGIFIADFALSYCFFQGAGDQLKNCI
ncbi:hypothetical protein ACSQ67_000945 [Phaseolus vulgaris]